MEKFAYQIAEWPASAFILVGAGGTVEHVFLSRSDGYEDGRVTIDRAVCGY